MNDGRTTVVLTANGTPVLTMIVSGSIDSAKLANEAGPWLRRAWFGLRLIFGRATVYELSAEGW